MYILGSDSVTNCTTPRTFSVMIILFAKSVADIYLLVLYKMMPLNLPVTASYFKKYGISVDISTCVVSHRRCRVRFVV